MQTKNSKIIKRTRRHKRIRSKVAGTAVVPRLSVFKSNKFMYAQLINDELGTTLAAYDSSKVKGKGMLEKAMKVGEEIAKLALANNISKVVFDRGGFIYTGRVKAVAEGARKAGLTF